MFESKTLHVTHKASDVINLLYYFCVRDVCNLQDYKSKCVNNVVCVGT